VYKQLLCLLIPLFPGSIMAALDTGDQLEVLSGTAMEAIDNQDYAGAVEVLRPQRLLPKHEIDGLVYQTRQQVPTIQGRFGKPRGSELVCVETIGSSLQRLTYSLETRAVCHAVDIRFLPIRCSVDREHLYLP
jgi:hypothetical protein